MEPDMSRVLWTLQVLLAGVFVFSGASKLLLPIELLQQQLPLPGGLIRFIGSVETLGAVGLILPALLRIRPFLTPLAAAGLAVLMTGATLLTPALTDGQYAAALLPLVLGVLAAVVAYGRWRSAPIGPSKVHTPISLAAR
jgi:DoxX-like family